MRITRLVLSLLLAAALAAPAFAQTNITLGRFFGACDTPGVSIADAVGEACIIQAIIDDFDRADNGVSVETLPTDWGNYYDQIKASYAAGNPPSVHVMHSSSIPEFASLGALTDLSDLLADAGIDSSDWTDRALAAVSYDGAVYGVPMDAHANLWHVNMELMAAAGLVDDAGAPILPSSAEELLAHAAQVKDATGANYLAADFAEFPIGVRLVMALVWQQGGELFDAERANVSSTEAERAVETIVSLFEAGYADPRLNYGDSQQSFLEGEAAILVNGTWVVDFYDAQAANPDVPLSEYYVADFPTLFDVGATWASNHMWVIPAPAARDADTLEAALALLAHINDNNLAWSRTGHLAVRTSVLESDAYAALPHRDEYTATADLARDVVPVVRYDAIQDVLNRELQAIWLTGKPIERALADANAAVQDLLD
ncbi:MAG: extracellular solute-binding protein [Trueperaceae bacterium]|nr:MAG: extracellular solute-binding protein [Trueperaceae bacterium]